ncbi:electron transfer flavoprotein subunit alpha/FixB family protein [Bartonella sp. LJL80]
MAILLLAEHDNHFLSEQTAKALSAAQAIGGDIDILVCGHKAQGVAASAARLAGVRKVLLAEADYLEHQLAEAVSATILQQSATYDVVMAAATTNGKNILPRVAALLDVMQVSDIIAVIAPDTFQRPIYAGNALETVRSNDAKKVITVRTASFAAVGEGGSALIETITPAADPALSRFVSENNAKNDRPELTSARVIVSGGRGLGSQEQFMAVLGPLAEQLNAALGASRAAVDAGYAPNDWQVGQTGKVVAPELYLAIGISGAIQHLAGMKDSKVIVAINKDEEAPIMQIADYALAGDLFELVPQLQKALS